ncbi:MAG: FAD-dependent oxidoreductase, partial [Cyclobacteriaceae bacterium]|nr:FAD-dependent oxidoreductase [Cyclobacteriaceae bacterium]
MLNADVVIVGAGIAGLSTALYLQQGCPGIKVLILDKEDGFSSNTNYAQGGMAAVFDMELDSFDAHVRDTLEAGRYKNDLSVVKNVVFSSSQVV